MIWNRTHLNRWTRRGGDAAGALHSGSLVPPRRITAGLILVWLLAAVPITVVEVPPLVDYPGQLARVHILANWAHLTGYDKFYRRDWALLPNLGLDIVAVPLAKVLPAITAMRVFFVLMLGALVLGGALLSRATSGRWTVWAFAPSLLVYNEILAFGFLNFLFALGIAFIALALHINSRDRPPSRRIIREFLFMIALFFSHFMALAIYGAMAGAYDFLSTLAERRPWKALVKDYLILGACACVPLLLMVFSPTRTEAHRGVMFSEVMWKLHKVLLTMDTGQGAWDVLFAVAVAVAVISLIARGYLRVHRVMAGVAAAIIVVFAVTPYRIGYASNLDLRMPLVVLFLGMAALEMRSEHSPIVVATLIVLLLFRVSTTTQHFYRSGVELERMRADLAVLPPGALVFTATGASAHVWSPSEWSPPLPHASELLLLREPFFSETLFTSRTQQPLIRTRAFSRLDVPGINDASEMELERYAVRMTSVLSAARRTEPAYVYLLKGPRAPQPPACFAVVLDRPRYAIYRLVR